MKTAIKTLLAIVLTLGLLLSITRCTPTEAKTKEAPIADISNTQLISPLTGTGPRITTLQYDGCKIYVISRYNGGTDMMHAPTCANPAHTE